MDIGKIELQFLSKYRSNYWSNSVIVIPFGKNYEFYNSRNLGNGAVVISSFINLFEITELFNN